MESKTPLNIVSLNTNGLGEVNKRRSVMGWLDKFHDAKNKIIFLQETHTTLRTEKIWKNEWKDWEIIFSSGDSSSRGVATFLPKNMDYEILETVISKYGRYVAISLTINSSPYCLINCYAPTIDKPREQLSWLAEIQSFLQKNEASNIIVGGDLNDYFIPHLDKYKCKPNVTPSDYVKAWKTLCDELNLTDIWRTLNPEKRCYTWRQGSSAARLKQSRLDYWLISTHLTYNLHNVDIKPSSRSDHSLIDIDFYKIEKSPRGPSYWSFNASLLKEKEYVEKINTCYNNALEKYNYLENKGLRWDLIKMEIRSTTICYSKTKAKETRAKLNDAIIQVSTLEKEISNNPTDEILEKYNEHKKYIENYNNVKANGAITRSRADWAEYGEKNSKYFLNLEKRNYKMKCITKLIKNETEEITDPDAILEYEESFYKTLYSVPTNNMSEEEKLNAAKTFQDDNLPKLSEKDQMSCESDLTPLEIGKALKELKNGKAPGTDGFTPDFYKFFWAKIKNTVLKV